MRAQRAHPQLGLATTYRTSSCSARQAPCDCYRLAEPAYIRCHPGHHHHLVCLDCGDVQETELCAAPPAELLRARYGFVPETHDLDIYGHCARCAA